MYAKAEAEAEAQEHGQQLNTKGIRQRTDRAPSKQPQQVNAKNIESIHQGEGEEDEDKDAQCSGVDCCVGASYREWLVCEKLNVIVFQLSRNV